jgi:hypothetical protein
MATRILGTVGKAMYAIALGTIVSPEALVQTPVAIVSHVAAMCAPMVAAMTAPAGAPNAQRSPALPGGGSDSGWITVGVGRTTDRSSGAPLWSQFGPA